MSIPGDRDPLSNPASGHADQEPARTVSYLDRALWEKLSSATSPEELSGFWLGLQCRMIDRVARAAVFLRSDETGPLAPAAFWPEHTGDGPPSLLATAKRAIGAQRGVVSGHTATTMGGGQLCCAAYPVKVNGLSRGAVAVELADRSEEQLRVVIRQLQWGVAWFELGYYRQNSQRAEHVLSTTGAALDLIGLLVETDGFDTACKTLVTELSTRLACDLVAVGSITGKQHKVVALSHSAEFGRRMNLVQSIVAAMEEATDQESIVCVPPANGADYRVTRAHEELAALLDEASILTIPLMNQDKPVGALMFQWANGHLLEQRSVDLCDAVAAVTGPILEEKRRNSRLVIFKVWDALTEQAKRLFGPHFLGRKLTLSTMTLLVLLFAFLEGSYRLSAPAKIEGRVQRVTIAPFDGYVASQSVRAGDKVKKGTVLATLDGRELTLELLRWTTTRQQRIAESDQAIAKHDRAGTNIVQAQIEQADARIALLEAQLQRVELIAPFDGIVVSGDLSQSIGAAVKRGDELFQIAPLDAYRVILEVDETHVTEISPGQEGELKVASLLDEILPYTIERITPITESRDSRNFFRVEAELGKSNDRLRPGMEGVAKTRVGDRLLIHIWTEDLVNWVRLKMWAWWP